MFLIPQNLHAPEKMVKWDWHTQCGEFDFLSVILYTKFTTTFSVIMTGAARVCDSLHPETRKWCKR